MKNHLIQSELQKREVFGFAQVDIQVPNQLYDRFSEMVTNFVVQEIPDCYILKEMNIYKEKTGEKRIKETKK